MKVFTFLPDAQRHTAFTGKLDRIIDEIDENLAQLLIIGTDITRQFLRKIKQ